METVVKKWGNSLALRLPQHIATGLNISEGATVSITVEDHSLVVKPVRKRYKLAELLADFDDTKRHPEIDWGKPVGKEAW
jgi:antitoxin MazE